ncbi:Uncharacterized protein HZ326_28792 [Fusarium oxysporum f. sp. albedinis]|nr:Uncharacterized protein HZ326_28792 [Fusarium oxysporum f. sp. albedinis]
MSAKTMVSRMKRETIPNLCVDTEDGELLHLAGHILAISRGADDLPGSERSAHLNDCFLHRMKNYICLWRIPPQPTP